MRVDKQLDLVFSVLVTSSRWESSREFEWVHARYPRFDVCTQVLSTYAALPFHRVFLYIELGKEYVARRGELNTTVHRLFGDRLQTFESQRLTTQNEWARVWQQLAPADGIGPGWNPATDARMVTADAAADAKHLIFFAQNDDHPFIDTSTATLAEGLQLLRDDNEPYKSLYLSHWAAALQLVGKLTTPARRGRSYVHTKLTQIDSIQIFNRGYLRYLLLELDWRGGSHGRIDMLVRQEQIYLDGAEDAKVMRTRQSLQSIYVPLRELCRKFDGYIDHLGIPAAITPPLVLPWGRNVLPEQESEATLRARITTHGHGRWALRNSFVVPPDWIADMLALYHRGPSPLPEPSPRRSSSLPERASDDHARMRDESAAVTIQPAAQIGAIVRYMSAVYPAAAARFGRMPHNELRELFEELDYFYACDRTRGLAYSPAASCADVEALGLRGEQLPSLPYVPHGTFYRAQEPVRLDERGSFTRFSRPVVRIVHDKIASSFHSSWHARVGPAPSWSSPSAVLRYVWAPSGLLPADVSASAGLPRRAITGSAHLQPPTALNSARWAALAGLRDSDWLEVEQFGGPMWNLCPDKCGLWANIWRGTGVFMRVRHPFVSYSKMTAVVEMLEAVEARGGTAHLRTLVDSLGMQSDVLRANGRYPRAGLAATLVKALVDYAMRTAGAPCTAAVGYDEVLKPTVAQSWLGAASDMSPDDVVRHLKLLESNASFAYHVHWLFGSCGVGVWRAKGGIWAGLDSMLARLACMLGVYTLILGFSPNDNGLLHSELVDFDLPEGLAWPVPSSGGLNPVGRCLTPLRQPSTAVVGDYYEQVGKFSLRDPTNVNGHAAPSKTCELLGPGRRWRDAKYMERHCEVAGGGDLFGSRSQMRCWIWCAGSMSEAHKSMYMSMRLEQPRLDRGDTASPSGVVVGADDQHLRARSLQAKGPTTGTRDAAFAADQRRRVTAAALTCPALSAVHPALSAVGSLPMTDSLSCSERYATILHCNGHELLFTRNETGRDFYFRTLVRQRRLDRLAEVGRQRFSAAQVALHEHLLMSHNAAFVCRHGKVVVAYGGQAHHLGSELYLGNDDGIMRLETSEIASASSGLVPLPWVGMPELALSGSKTATRCIDERLYYYSDPALCEYDGKVSATTFRGRVLVYSRSNRSPKGGARHVQVSSSRDGRSGWSHYEQLVFAGGSFGIETSNNIYHFTVRPLNERQLLAVFPATRLRPSTTSIDAGLYASVSLDGVNWSAPKRLFEASFDKHYRIAHSPVDGDLSLTAALSSRVRLLVEHGIDTREANNQDKSTCTKPPIICSYDLDVAKLLVDQTSQALPSVVSDTAAGANLQPTPTSSTSPTPADDAAVYQDRLDYVHTLAYLEAVYPAARESLRALDAQQLRMHFNSLEYYYACPQRFQENFLQPKLQCSAAWPAKRLPYLPGGAYYFAWPLSFPEDAQRIRRPYLEASFVRHAYPVAELSSPLRYPFLGEYHTTFGARMGPQPSWTSPVAILRHVLHPHGIAERDAAATKGLHCSGVADSPTPCEVRQHQAWRAKPNLWESHPPNLWDHPRVWRLMRIADGEYVEVENWGGWSLDDCPPACGLWANIWKGTGTAMRVSTPFAALNKATAIVGMLQSLGSRSSTALTQLTDTLGLSETVASLQHTHPAASLAASVVKALLLRGGPCPAAEGSKRLHEEWQAFQQAARRLSPEHLVIELVEPRSFAMHWLHGVCGLSTHHTLIATLACMLGHKTIVLAASSNDNGLLHPELVDYELPTSLGWTSAGTDHLQHCMRPFGFAAEDVAAGADALAHRQQQIYSHHMRTGKFVLPAARTEAYVYRAAMRHTAQPCQIVFGDLGAWQAAACTIRADENTSTPTLSKGCFASCRGAISQATAGVSLFQVQVRQHVNKRLEELKPK